VSSEDRLDEAARLVDTREACRPQQRWELSAANSPYTKPTMLAAVCATEHKYLFFLLCLYCATQASTAL
jgi:hypothetical protein